MFIGCGWMEWTLKKDEGLSDALAFIYAVWSPVHRQREVTGGAAALHTLPHVWPAFCINRPKGLQAGIAAKLTMESNVCVAACLNVHGSGLP